MTLPNLATDLGLSRYLEEIRRFPVLSAEEEASLARRWLEQQDTRAAHRLVTSHLRLVAKVAMGYRGYGLPISDLIAEGNLGLMHSVKKFNPDRGFRLATYAVWWIKASIQEYVLRSWSLVKIGTTAAQKKLFFNLRRLKNKLADHDRADLSPQQVQGIAKSLSVTEREVISMNQRLAGGDQSLNAPLNNAEGDSVEWQDTLVDTRASQEDLVAEKQETKQRRQRLREALSTLKDRERRIITARWLADAPATLEALAAAFGISRERVRQIEARAMQKMQEVMGASHDAMRPVAQEVRMQRSLV